MNVGVAEGQATSAAATAKPVATAESVDKTNATEEKKTQTGRSEQQDQADNAGQPEAAAAQLGILKPDKARPTLEILTENITAVQVDNKGRVELSFDTAQLRKDAAELKSSNNPLNKAAGFDLEVALIQSDLANLDSRAAKQNMAKSAVEAHRKQLNSQLEQLRVQREQLKGADGRPIESQLGKLTASLTEKGTEAEKKMAQDNPLDLFEKKFNQAAKNKTVRADLFNSLRSAAGASLTAEDKAALEEQIKITGETMDGVSSDNQKIKAKEVKGRLFKIGGLAALLPILMAWLASKKKEGGGGGMG